jgi:hypothetical protein
MCMWYYSGMSVCGTARGQQGSMWYVRVWYCVVCGMCMWCAVVAWWWHVACGNMCPPWLWLEASLSLISI